MKPIAPDNGRGKGYGGFLLCYNGLHMARVPERFKGKVNGAAAKLCYNSRMGKYTTLPQNAPLEQKLASYTLNGECWEYNGCTDSDGYCQIMVDKKLRYAHRLSWEFHNGRQIPKGMTIDHICFNRKCINPKHLRLSSPASNSARHGATKLKTFCDKHGCRRKIIWRWKAKRKKLVRESVCPECQREAVRRSIRKRRERNHE